MQINFGSLNINGFNKSTDKLAHFIFKHNIHVTFIQETHTIQHQQLSHFQHRHTLLAYPNSDHSLTPTIAHKQGTLTLINNKHLHLNPQTILSQIILPNYIQSISFTLSNVNYTLINCYLPSGKTNTQTSNRIKAIKTLTSYLHNLDFKNKHLIIAGDFNLVLNPIDRTGHYTPNTTDKILFQNILTNFDLSDSYRYLYPNSQTYSFSRTCPISRLDRIYISSPLLSQIIHSSYHHISFSDHNKAPLLSLKIPSKTKYKSSHWKLNDSILDSSSTILYTNLFIKSLFPSINPIQQPLQWWDLIKFKIKKLLIFRSKQIHNKNTTKQNTLRQNLSNAKLSQHYEEIYNISAQLEQMEQHTKLGSQIRSRLPPLISIDNPSPLAPITENLMQTKSLLSSNSNPSPPLPTEQNTSNNFSSYLSFFNNLWNPTTSYPNPSAYLDPIFTSNPNILSQNLSTSPLITQTEIREAIKSLNTHSAPGLDGLTPSFYNSFPLLIPILCQTFNNSYLQKHLTSSQSRALIKLIPKKSNPTSIKDWRPISLLNTDYKILSSIISTRIKPILNSTISLQQQCGLPNRQIFNNHLNILSAIDFTNDFVQPLAILQIDFYKAFDTISHEFILSTASKLGIPVTLLNWIRIFLTDSTAQLNLNGYLSDPISVKCGIRQGCPLSMLLFLIGIEPLTKKILASSKIQGISIGTSSLKVSHYADDLTLFISSPQSFPAVRETIEEFSSYSGLKINHAKTSIISNSPTLLSSFRNTFPQGKILTSAKILGITFSFHKEDLSKNWDDLIRSLPHTSLAILNPKDSLYSKTISLNQHFLPRILFLSRIIPPTPKQIKSLTTLLFKFLWNFSPFEPIKRSTLYLPKSDGGIALPNIGIKTTTAFLWKFIYLLKTPNPHSFFWMAYAIYNIGTNLLPIKPELYSNSQPHRPKPNLLWSKTLSLYKKITTPLLDIENLSFKTLYLTLLQPETNPIPSLDSETPHNWLRLTLIKPRPSLFSNLEKEISFRSAYKGFTWGCFFSKHNIKPQNPDDFLCKLCSLPSDDPHHLFFFCPYSQKLIKHFESQLSFLFKKPTCISQNTLLFNHTNTTGMSHIITTKLASLIRLSLYHLRNYLSLINIPISNSLLNEEKYKIKTKFKTFLEKNFPDFIQ